MIFRSLLGLVGALLMTILFLWRIKDEEEMLRKEFGEEWEGYCNQKFEGIRMTKKIVYVILPRALWIFMAVCLYLGQKLTNSPPILTDNLFLFCSGILLSVGGFLLWMYVGYYMRLALFTKELMVSGPFKYIRHPMYVGIYIMLVGIGLLFFSWIWFITMLIFIPIWYLDCKIEEKQMTQLQGKKYLEYKKELECFSLNYFEVENE